MTVAATSPWAYLAAIALVVLGVFILVWSAPKRGERQFAFAVAIVLVLAGAIVWAGGVISDFNESESLRTFSFRYFVDVRPSGPAPVRLYLPAPVDSRLVEVLAAANGTSNLWYDASGPVASVVVDATGHVSFDIRFRHLGLDANWTLTRVTPTFPPADSFERNVSVELSGASSDPVLVVLEIEFSEACSVRVLEMDASVTEGAGSYPATRYAYAC